MFVEFNRDGLTEEKHEVSFARLSTKKFDDNTPYYLRSCAKPLQATLLVDYNIDLTEQELAICCGSHSGEEIHIKTLQGIMKKFDIKLSDLKCGIHAPLSRTMQDKMLLNNEQPTELHNNCSGKHLGFLAICKQKNWDTKNYDDIDHPLQIAIKETINTMCEVQQKYPITTDGCGVPILSMPLYNMLIGFNKLQQYPQIINAIKNNPYLFGGENRLDTEIIQKSKNLIAKVGAGGLCVVMNLKNNDCFVVKVQDASMPARRFAVFDTINKLGWDSIDIDNTIKTISGKVVGKVFCKYSDYL